MFDKNKIIILCKVVDNFGDIGVVYRLARALSDLRPELELTLVVSNLDSFHKMASQIDPKKTIQDFRYKNSTWKILDWNLETESGKRKTENEEQLLTPDCSVILECFQCGRPDWLENILFAPDFAQTVQIIQIDYLTAEDYADEFHLLKSGTRKTNIKKIFFMPGFTPKTGGLIINDQPVINSENPGFSSLTQQAFKIFFFAYEDDCTSVVNGISAFQDKMREMNKEFSVTVYLADGKSCVPFERSWKKINSPFKIEKIPFLQQEEFDYFIAQMDFLFVRGEDSLARAALTGLPYVWQAYKQDENYQLVKVNALLERMKESFGAQEFEPIQLFWQSYNDYKNQTQPEPLTKMLLDCANLKNTAGFKAFAKELHENGNLANAATVVFAILR